MCIAIFNAPAGDEFNYKLLSSFFVFFKSSFIFIGTGKYAVLVDFF